MQIPVLSMEPREDEDSVELSLYGMVMLDKESLNSVHSYFLKYNYSLTLELRVQALYLLSFIF